MAKKLRPVTTGDLYNLKQLFNCSLSPCGNAIVTSVDAINKAENKKYMNLYVQPTGGGELRQFTRGESSDHSPAFSPDGKLIAFISNRSKKSQLHLICADGGESWQLTKQDGGVGSFNWAPDSKSIVFTFSPQDEEEKEREPTPSDEEEIDSQERNERSRKRRRRDRERQQEEEQSQ